MSKKKLNQPQVEELLYQAFETELGGVKIYETALRCVVNEDLQKEWKEYLDQTKNHVKIAKGVLEKLDMNPEKQVPGRLIVRHIGQSLVQAMEMALKTGDRNAAQLVAAECVVLAETKDHANWELLGELAEGMPSEQAKVVKDAQEEVEDEEDEHLYHTTGWARELWLESLGLPAVLPPPEEVRDVKTAIGAARAKQAREEMV